MYIYIHHMNMFICEMSQNHKLNTTLNLLLGILFGAMRLRLRFKKRILTFSMQCT